MPFTEEDGAGLLSDPLAVIDRYRPGASELLRQRGVERLEPIREYYPMGSIQHRLGFRPSRNFDQWLKKLESQPEALADKPSPWP